MLNEHRTFKLKAASGETVEVEINWSDNLKVKDCGLVRFKVGDEEVELQRNDLASLMMLLGNAEEQKKMMPMKLTKVRKLERMLTFEWQASKDYKKGEKVTVKAPWIDTATDVEEVLQDAVKNLKKGVLKHFIK